MEAGSPSREMIAWLVAVGQRQWPFRTQPVQEPSGDSVEVTGTLQVPTSRCCCFALATARTRRQRGPAGYCASRQLYVPQPASMPSFHAVLLMQCGSSGLLVVFVGLLLVFRYFPIPYGSSSAAFAHQQPPLDQPDLHGTAPALSPPSYRCWRRPALVLVPAKRTV